MKRYLLDTGLLLGFARRAPWAINARETLDLGDPETMVFTSVICQGENSCTRGEERMGYQQKRTS